MHGLNDTVTIWNRLVENGKTKYFRHIVHGCYWRAKALRGISGSDVSLASVLQVMIGIQDEYKPLSEWLALTDKSAFFTFNVGDIIARGERTEEMTATTATSIYSALKPDVFTIKAVTDNTQPWKYGQHIMVEGA